MSRAVIHEEFGGPEVLELRELPEPHAGPGEVRVRVTYAALNPVDWKLVALPELAELFEYTIPSGFGNDLAGVIDEVGDGVSDYKQGDRVYGGARGKAVADYVVLEPDSGPLLHTPEGLSDEIASTLLIAGRTAQAALATIGLQAGDTVLIGGAGGGVGTFAVQLAKLAGATVIGTGSESTFAYLRELGAEPVAYGPGLAERVQAAAPQGITAATDLVGTETAEVALALGVPAQRISTVAVGPNPPGGVRATGAGDAAPGALDQVTAAILAGKLTVPIVASFPIEQIQEAVMLQRAGHVHGKVVIALAQ